jgi:hypothetical protein
VRRPGNGAPAPEPVEPLALDLQPPDSLPEPEPPDADRPEPAPDPPPKRKPTNPAAERIREIFAEHEVPEKLWPPWPVAGRWVKEWNGDGGPGHERLFAALGKLGAQGHLGRGFAWSAKLLTTWLAYGGEEPPPVESAPTRRRQQGDQMIREYAALTAGQPRRGVSREEALEVLKRCES